jgi:hypothetical protein
LDRNRRKKDFPSNEDCFVETKIYSASKFPVELMIYSAGWFPVEFDLFGESRVSRRIDEFVEWRNSDELMMLWRGRGIIQVKLMCRIETNEESPLAEDADVKKTPVWWLVPREVNPWSWHQMCASTGWTARVCENLGPDSWAEKVMEASGKKPPK